MSEVVISLYDLRALVVALETGKIAMTEILDLINQKDNHLKVETDEIALIIDYSRTLQEMINAGNYQGVNRDITEEHFPLPSELIGKKVTVVAKLFHFKNFISKKDALKMHNPGHLHSVSRKEAIIEMDKEGFRLATPAELLAYVETCRNLQTKFMIAAFGYIWQSENGVPLAPVFYFKDNKRKLNLQYNPEQGLRGNFAFLGVKK